MINKLGIIPAGGKAERFGGMLKELLPISTEDCFLSRVLNSMKGAELRVVITNKEKIGHHAQATWIFNNVIYKLQYGTGLWSAIQGCFDIEAIWYLFAMPDTYYPESIFENPALYNLSIGFGVFDTVMTKRFGVIGSDNQIHDKTDETGQAWGVAVWSRKTVDYWRGKNYSNHTDAFNDAMKRFGFSVVKMPFYYDMASMQDYRRFVREVSYER